MKMLSFVIPCYNSAKTILTVVNEVRQTMEGRKEFTFEIILVNDNSTDETFSVIKQAALKDGRLTAIDLAKNFGQHSALMAGYSQATGDYIVSLDDDGQTPANEVFRLIDKLENGFDVVFASYPQKKHSFFRNFGSRINDMMAHHLIGKPKGLYLSSYFVARRFVIEELKRYTNAYPYVSGLLLRSTNRLANVSVNHRDREIGTSGYTLKKLLALWMNGFTAFSVKPLRIASLLGVIFAGIGFLYGIWIIISKLFIRTAPIGYSSLMAVLLFIGGTLMLILGMLGEYVGRMYISINRAPQYVIRELCHEPREDQRDI
ncbi:glycosyltransferase family 2 protein [Anaeromassilibacillus sp. SJQ-5]